METLKVGTKFFWKRIPETVYTIIKITDTRVVYTNGQTSFAGSSNRKQSSCWLTIKGLKEKINKGEYILI